MKRLLIIGIVVFWVIVLFLYSDTDVLAAGTVKESGYVTLSPDGRAWTFEEELPEEEGAQSYPFWYPEGFCIETGKVSTLRALQAGEHYYAIGRHGEIPVGQWRVAHPFSRCVHKLESYEEYCGLEYGTKICGRPYFSGWLATCADCSGPVREGLIYGSMDAVASVNSINVDLGIYYLCPSCTHLEQGKYADVHVCKAISANRYLVRYEGNAPNGEAVSGEMEPSLHMYNNATEYDGMEIVPLTRLHENTFSLRGYTFVGWNTKPDGSGIFYADRASVYNLTAENYDEKAQKGIVILYAQWRKIKTQLIIDPAGGSYLGSMMPCVVRGEFDQKYRILSETVLPPGGYQVRFETNGGASIAPMESQFVFERWSLQAPASGRLTGEHYVFGGKDGDVDLVKAWYRQEEILLPKATKENATFSGWYLDPECTEPVGSAGEPYIPNGDKVLYAGWSNLRLYAKNNEQAYNGTGAVDLSWSQDNAEGRVYKLYQSTDGVTYREIWDAQSSVSNPLPQYAFGLDEYERTLTVPSSGFYRLSAYGAQGGDFDQYSGGSGAGVSGKFYLKAGEILTIRVGGKNGYNGGGSAQIYGNGGGYTIVSSNLKGTLLIAGGGGGATQKGDGGSGGAESGLSTHQPSKAGNFGESGSAGGGGGYIGGAAGEAVEELVFSHCHSANCPGVCPYYYRGTYTVPLAGTYRISAWGAQGGSASHYCLGIGPGGFAGSISASVDLPKGSVISFQIGRSGEDIKQESVEPGAGEDWAEGGRGESSYVWLDGELVLHGGGGEGGWHRCFNYDDTYSGDEWGRGGVGIGLQEGGNLKDIVTASDHEGEGKVSITYMATNPSGGGSSYVNTDYAITYSMEVGVRKGDGEARVEALSLGFLEEMHLDNVAAPDRKAPEAIDVTSIQKVAAEGNTLRILFDAPADRGSVYYHKAESYPPAGTDICVSNITKNTLTSGIRGYVYLEDTKAGTIINTTNFTSGVQMVETEEIIVSIVDGVKYVHVAVVDKAGNLSETVHIRIEEADKAWSVHTTALQISDVVSGEAKGSIHPAAATGSWYVKADGHTPFVLSFSAALSGPAREDYQVNRMAISAEESLGGKTQSNMVTLPLTRPICPHQDLNARTFIRRTLGERILSDAMYLGATRRDNAAVVDFYRAFTLPRDMHGREVFVYPLAGADKGLQTTWSDQTRDRENGLTLLADGRGPLIHGLDKVEEILILHQENEGVEVTLSAQDELSGVADFYVKISNLDHYGERVYRADETNRIHFEIAREDLLFGGDFLLTAYASDHVGNETVQSIRVSEFALEASVWRILQPHDPIFRGGESGILIVTSYGYVDRIEVEFPKALSDLSPALNQEIVYEIPDYKQEDSFTFMVPLYAPEKEAYTIVVRAYKGDRMLEEHPVFATLSVNGNVLEEIRTRLR
jgi:hypothetical protein